ncbi:MAG: ATP-binding protein [Chlamydiota bacterium]
MTKPIGREKELEILETLFKSKEAQFLAVYGRRRVGKTYLISNFFRGRGVYFELTGIKNAKLDTQLLNFSEEFTDCFLEGRHQPPPKSWQEAFAMLRRQIEMVDPQKKVLIFLDELPWLASKRSLFLSSLDHLWNRYLSRHSNVILIVCGSATAWILKKIIQDRGGFYGRLTAEINLKPYTLSGTENFFKVKNIELERKQIIELYLAFGGVPKYLNYVERGKSPAQIIQEVCFGPQGPLSGEFNRLFTSLFDDAERHLKVVESLASCRSGLALQELEQLTGLSSGGGFTETLKELQASGFISFIPNLGNAKRAGKYRLTDEYSLFYLTWIKPAFKEHLGNVSINYWQQMQNSPRYHAWTGYAFESICLKHVNQIVTALGLSGIIFKACGWFARSGNDHFDESGSQIDLVIERSDHCTNLCEIKFSNTPFVITKDYEEKLRRKKECYRQATKTRNTLFTTMITPFGVIENAQYFASVDNQITMDALFTI